MSAFLILSAMTSALLLVMAALMDRRAIGAGGDGKPWRLRLAVALSALMTVPVAWVIWTAAGAMPAANLAVAAALWHGAWYFLFAFWIHSRTRRAARDQTKA